MHFGYEKNKSNDDEFDFFSQSLGGLGPSGPALCKIPFDLYGVGMYNLPEMTAPCVCVYVH